jgi:hypothetical protein
MEKIKYRPGDRLKIVDLETLRECEYVNPSGKMEKWAGKTMTVVDVDMALDDGVVSYLMIEDNQSWYWYDDMIKRKLKNKIKGVIL